METKPNDINGLEQSAEESLDPRLRRGQLGLKVPQWLIDEFAELTERLKRTTGQPISNVQTGKAAIVLLQSLAVEQQLRALLEADVYCWRRTQEILAERDGDGSAKIAADRQD